MKHLLTVKVKVFQFCSGSQIAFPFVLQKFLKFYEYLNVVSMRYDLLLILDNKRVSNDVPVSA